MTIRKTTSIKTKGVAISNANTSAALANASIPSTNSTTAASASSMRLHRLHHGHYAHHSVVIMASPSRRTTLLQRQVARALDCFDMDESVGENANEMTDGLVASAASSSAAAYASPPTLATKKTPPPSASLAALSAPTFQISPNAVKRKRSHSMASTNSSSSSSHSAVSTAGVASTATSASSLATDLRVDIDAIDRAGGGASRVVAKRAIKTGGVTPSKRCNGKDKKKKQKVDVIERALKRFRSELREASDSNSPATCFEFTSLCPKDEADTARVATPRHHAHTSQIAVAQHQRVRVQVGVAAAQGARAYMEDRFQVTAKLFEHHEQRAEVQSHASLLAVYDGHNGPLAAEYGASRFRELLSDNEFLLDLCKRPAFVALADDEIDRIESILTDAFEVVDEEIVELTISEGKRDGSTVLLGLLICGKLFVANLGDTRGVLGTNATTGDDGDEDVVRVSVDHKPDLKAETARVEEAGGKVIFSGCWRVAHDEIPLRLAVSRSLGDHPLKANLPLSCSAPLVSVVPDIQVLDVSGSSDDVLVFATDGLWDRLSDDDAIRIARTKIAEYKASGEPQDGSAKNAMQSAAIALVETALVKRSMDNITAMVVSFSTEETPRLDDVETLAEGGNDEIDPDL